MRTYPIMLDLTGRTVVVVGSGPVGLRKTRALIACGAKVRLVSPAAPVEALPDGATHVRESYRSQWLDGASLVFACTDDRELNARVAADARETGRWVNVADHPAECDFHVPATFCDGPVVVAVGTSAAAPSLSAVLRDRIAEQMPERVGEFAIALGQVKRALVKSLPSARERHDQLRILAGPKGYEAFRNNGLSGLRELAGLRTNP